jgi:hypothetical protein
MASGRYDPNASGGGLNPGPAFYASVGAGLLGFASSDPKMGLPLQSDFEANPLPPGLTTATASGGTPCIAVAASKGGVSRNAITTTAGSFARMFSSQRLTQLVTTDKWYWAWRFRSAVAPAAGTRANMGLGNIADGSVICVGINGDSSTTNYTFRYDGHPTSGSGTLVNLNVAIDQTNWHIFECWHPGDGKYHFRIDGGAEFTPVTPAGAITDTIVFDQVFNGTGGTADAMDRDWFVYLYPRF